NAEQTPEEAELDAVVGHTRLPTFADYPHLPYIRATSTVKETLRWRPVDPVGLPHQSIEDEWYEGMFIPEGTVRPAWKTATRFWRSSSWI
ncbi:hypothetical protein F5888DRAFT_1730961, partial [Russula emetica]